MTKDEKLSKKELFTCLGILVFLVVVLVLLLNSNNEKQEELSSDYADYLEVTNNNALNGINNSGAFRESIYDKNSKDYIEQKSKYMSMYVINMLSNERKEIEFEKLTDEEIIYLLNSVLAGDGENICYSIEYFKDKVYEYFGITEIYFSGSSYYYEMDNNYICFEEVFTNLVPTATITNYVDDGNNIRVFLSLEDRNLLFNYEKTTENVFLKSVLEEG